MNVYVFYEDIPLEERKKLSKEEFKKDITTRLCNSLSIFMGIVLGILISENTFSVEDKWPGIILSSLLACGLTVIFHLALVKPRIIRLIERRKNPNKKMDDIC